MLLPKFIGGNLGYKNNFVYRLLNPRSNSGSDVIF